MAKRPVRAPRRAMADKVEICKAYREIPVKGGIKRAEAGDYIITSVDGSISVKPPSVYHAEKDD